MTERETIWFSYSQIEAFLRCERKWMYRYVGGWKPVEPSKPLQLGTLMHDLVARWWRGEPVGRLVTRARSVGPPDMPVPQWRETAAWLIERYDQAYTGQHEQITVVEQETFHRVLLPDYSGEGPRFGIIFVPDLICTHAGFDGFMLFEHKTMGRWERAREDILEIDPQVSTYLWGLREEGWHMSIGFFDAINTYHYKTKRPPTDSFKRPMVDRSGAQLETFAHNTWKICRKMLEARERESFTVHVKGDCASCDFFNPCYEHLLGATRTEAALLEENYVQRSEPVLELVDLVDQGESDD